MCLIDHFQVSHASSLPKPPLMHCGEGRGRGGGGIIKWAEIQDGDMSMLSFKKGVFIPFHCYPFKRSRCMFTLNKRFFIIFTNLDS